MLRRHDLQAGGLLDVLGIGTVERVGDVGLARLQHQRAGRRLGHAAHDQGLDVRHAPPIAGKGLQHDLDAGLGADEFIRAGADRVLFETVISDFRHVFLRHDDAGGGRGRAVERHEIGPRLLQVKPHHARIDDLDLFDVLLQRLGAGAVVALEAELDVLGRDRVAIVESESLTQTELVGLAVLALLPGFGEARTHLLPGIRADERVVNRVEHAEGRDLCRRARRIEPGRRNCHMPSHDGASLRRRTLGSERRRRAGEDPERQQNRRHAAAQPERPHPAPPDRPMLFCQRGHRERDCRPIYRVAATGLARPSPPGEARPSLGYFALRLAQGRRAQPPAAGLTSLSPAERPGRAHGPVIVWPVPAVIIRPMMVVARVPVSRVPVMVPIMRAVPAKAVPPAACFGRLRPEHPGEHQNGKCHKDLLHGILRGITPGC